MIEFTRVSKQYAREVYALRDITLSVKKGELIFLAGPPAPASPRC
jgi:cell division transport system ATP-binding protein